MAGYVHQPSYREWSPDKLTERILSLETQVRELNAKYTPSPDTRRGNVLTWCLGTLELPHVEPRASSTGDLIVLAVR